jgi:hypothetical protein
VTAWLASRLAAELSSIFAIIGRITAGDTTLLTRLSAETIILCLGKPLLHLASTPSRIRFAYGLKIASCCRWVKSMATAATSTYSITVFK